MHPFFPYVSEALCGWASIGFIPDPVCDLAALQQKSCANEGVARKNVLAHMVRSFQASEPIACMVDRRIRRPEMRRFAYRVSIDSQWWGSMSRSCLVRVLGSRNPSVASGNEISRLLGFGARGNAVDALPGLPYIKEG
ncbi:hypothetical protein D9M68_859280 [compost metagenome]